MDKNKTFSHFLERVAKIFEVLQVTENKEETVKHLVSSFILNFSNLLSSDPNISPLLNEYSKTGGNSPEKLFDFLDSKNADYQSHLLAASKESLQSFVTALAPSLSPEKVTELNTIISQ